jgi:hypothetical protein
MTGENLNSRRGTCPGVSESTANVTLTALGSNMGLCGERQAKHCLRRSTTFLFSWLGEHDICAYRHENFKSHVVEVSVIPLLDRLTGGEARVCCSKFLKNARYTFTRLPAGISDTVP